MLAINKIPVANLGLESQNLDPKKIHSNYFKGKGEPRKENELNRALITFRVK